MEASLLAGLNAAQRAAVTSPASVLQVLAPPGSGKTKTLTSRVAYLLAHHGYTPQNVICCTFTIKASREMRERLRGLVGPELESKLILGTFHSICRRYLVAYGNLIGLPKNFGIADTSDSTSIIKRIVKRLKLNLDHKTARSKISHHKARGKRIEDLPKGAQKKVETQEFITIFHEYETALATSNLLDYDDLLLRCVDLLRAYPNCVYNVEALLIDEFQDTNIVQFELTKLLASSKRRITIVGDPDQSIYGFRSAEIENLTRMRSYYRDTVVVNLEENYRSSSAVLKLAQDVIEQDSERPDKKLRATHCYGTLPVLRRLPNPHEEALWITSEIKRMMLMTAGLVKHSDIAILLRSAYLSLLIEKAFTSAGIPYRMVGGQRFFDRAEIRLVVDYLRTISHPENNPAFLSIINVPSRKIGDTTIAALIKAAESKDLSVWSAVQKLLSGNLSIEKKLSMPAEQDLHKLVNLIKTAREKMRKAPPQQVPGMLIEYVVTSLDLEGYIKKKFKEDHEDRLENIKELIIHATEVASLPNHDEQLPEVQGVSQQNSEAGQEVLAQFLANIVLSTEVETSEKGDDKPRVTISTIHSAKGLEWPIVFVPAVYEGSIPHSRAENTDEERRLLYVAMTRAQALLTLSFPVVQSREQGESVLTQFLPADVHHRLAQSGPLFSDKVIADIAKILRREPPTQEALVESLQALPDGGSRNDDVWPMDGSHRQPFAASDNSQALFAGQGVTLAEALKSSAFGNQRSSYSTLANAAAWGIQGFDSISTTMNNTSALSTANMSLGFTTATHHLNRNLVSLAHTKSEPTMAQKKQKLAKTNSAQGSIATFFSLDSSKTQPAPNTHSLLPCGQFVGRPAQRFEPDLPPVPHQPPTSDIPEELRAHKLGSVSTCLGHKRPRPALEIASPTRKRYVFLSSSPSRDTDEKRAHSLQPFGKPSSDGQPVSLSAGTIGSIPLITSAKLNSRPANTMHTTSMSSVMPNGYGIGRKTLGVRRTMNGWDARKHK